MGKSEGNQKQVSPSRMILFHSKQGGLIKWAGSGYQSETVIKLFGRSFQTQMADREKGISAGSDDLG